MQRQSCHPAARLRSNNQTGAEGKDVPVGAKAKNVRMERWSVASSKRTVLVTSLQRLERRSMIDDWGRA